MKKRWKGISGWQDVVELVLAAWIFVSPVVLGYFTVVEASITALLVGAIVSLTSQLGIAKQQPWEEWFNLVVAAIFITSPWLFGYSTVVAATLNAVISGLLLAIFAIAALIHEYAELRQLRHPTTHGPV